VWKRYGPVNHWLNGGTRRPCFAVILIAALATAQTANGIQPSDTNPPIGGSAAALEAPRGKIHLSAQALQAIYLSGVRLGAQKAGGGDKTRYGIALKAPFEWCNWSRQAAFPWLIKRACKA
jgi:hypothetical protein